VKPAFRLRLAASAALAAALPGCIPVLLGGAAAGGGYAAGQERGIGDTVRDTGIKSAIADKWYRYDQDMNSQLNLSVYQGRVVITGAVSNPEWRVEAVRLAWQVDGVKEVHSDVEVANKSTLVDAARDTWISTRLRSAITFDPQIRSLNYSVETVNGTVFLMGSARTQGELDLVTNYARNIPNVRRVVSYVEVRPGEPSRGANEATPSSAPPMNAPPMNAPAPNVSPDAPATPPLAPPAAAPVEVRPLS
jgi:osmotically-inducible protein OsmY